MFLEHRQTDTFVGDDATNGDTVTDPKRTPETMGGCSYAGCGCSAYVRSYNGDCDSCQHPANAHW